MTKNPFVFHFYLDEDAPSDSELRRAENIRLWKDATSGAIADSIIGQAVYSSTLSDLRKAFNTRKSDNKFLQWIIDHNAVDYRDFLLVAKELEELRFNRVSAWYYPSDKSEPYESRTERERFEAILDACRNHKAGPLADRYGLQYIRALMALRQYDMAYDFWQTSMKGLPDDNLFKKMAKGYVAGCLLRMGRKDKAYRMFAELGDFYSISFKEREQFVPLVRINPEAYEVKSLLNGRIGCGDRNDNLVFLSVADAALSSPHVKHRGDWLFLKAYIEEIYNVNHSKAIGYLKKAMETTFSTESMRRDAELMKACLELEQGRISDLKSYVGLFAREVDPYFFYLVPALLKCGRTSEAILMANYASCFQSENCGYSASLVRGRNIHRVRIEDSSHALTGFQLMLSRKAEEVIDYKNFLNSDSPVVKLCKDSVIHDDDYLDELIGTLYLREGNYKEAVRYLSSVSEDYQKKLNVYRYGYLRLNPWVNCYMPQDKWEYPENHGYSSSNDDGVSGICESFESANSSLLKSQDNAKLNFATEMVRLSYEMRSGDADRRGLARIRYALARYNSFNRCWALTQYWSGQANQCNYQPFYWLWNGDYRSLDYVETPAADGPDEKWLRSEMEKGMKELRSQDAIAEAHYLSGNYKTIARKYPSSAAGRLLSSHCDNWNDWL